MALFDRIYAIRMDKKYGYVVEGSLCHFWKNAFDEGARKLEAEHDANVPLENVYVCSCNMM